MDVKDLSKSVDDLYKQAFGRTPLNERLQDILQQTLSVVRFSDNTSLREEIGDLLAASIQLCNECNWSAEDAVMDSLQKIKRRMPQYKTLGRKTQVVIMGGAFDPITVGHIKSAQFILDAAKSFDEVWITPCFSHMNNKKMTGDERRLRMCQLAVSMDCRIKVFDYEIRHQLKGETYYFLKRLLDDPQYKDAYEFCFAIGLDNAFTFPNWVNSTELERLARFIVVPRKGYELKPGDHWFLKPPHIYLYAESDVPEISSTQIRKWTQSTTTEKEMRQNRANLQEYLNPDVLDYMRTEKLYGFK